MPRIIRALLAALVVVGALAVSGPALADVGTVSFTGENFTQEISGTFTLDHFAVETILLQDLFVEPQPPKLAAVGTVTGQVTDPFGDILLTFDDAPFVWLNTSVAAACGDGVTVTLDQILGSDYTTLHGEWLYGSSVPIPVWNGSVHWGVNPTDATKTLELTGNGGLACAIGQAINRNDLEVEARLLNALLRQQ
jgi:hypothetical protein